MSMKSALVFKPGQRFSEDVVELNAFFKKCRELADDMGEDVEVLIQNGKVKQDVAAVMASLNKSYKTFGATGKSIHKAASATIIEIDEFLEERREKLRTASKQAAGAKGGSRPRRERAEGVGRNQVRQGRRQGVRAPR